jgi:hypothetical protein
MAEHSQGTGRAVVWTRNQLSGDHVVRWRMAAVIVVFLISPWLALALSRSQQISTVGLDACPRLLQAAAALVGGVGKSCSSM